MLTDWKKHEELDFLNEVSCVPLFVPKAGKESSFLVINRNNQDFIPFFFEKAAALQMVEQYKKANPAEATTAR